MFRMKKLFAFLMVFNVIAVWTTTAFAAMGTEVPPDLPSDMGSDNQPPDGVPSDGGEQPPDDDAPNEIGEPGAMAPGEQAPDDVGGQGAMPGGQPGGSSGVESYDAVTEFDSDASVSDQSYTSTGVDENAILISGGTVGLDQISVSRISSDSTGGDNASFYGVGAAILATGETTSITNSTITTDANGGAGVFAYGDGIVYVSDSTISTTKDTSGGIHAAGGGTIYASDLDVTTQGGSSAAIRSDRGGGLMVVDGGSYIITENLQKAKSFYVPFLLLSAIRVFRVRH